MPTAASYLNLIKHEQRPLTLKVLMKLGETFKIDLNAFSAKSDGGQLADLGVIMADPLFKDHGLGEQDLSGLVEAAPGAAEATCRLCERADCAARAAAVPRRRCGGPHLSLKGRRPPAARLPPKQDPARSRPWPLINTST